MKPHTERFLVRSYDVDPRGRASIGSLCGWLQEAAGVHATALGVSMDRLAEEDLAWMIHRLKIEIDRMPRLGEPVAVETWPTGFARALATRDFRIVDQHETELARASSVWVVADVVQRRAIRIPDWIQEIDFTPAKAVVDIPGRRVGRITRTDVSADVKVLRSDLDRVDHVNNVRYAQWLLEAIPEDLWNDADLAGVDLLFRAECTYGDTIVIETMQEDLQLTHRFTRVGTTGEIAQARTNWRRIT